MPRKPVPAVLLTGFEPFGGDAVNPSQELLRGLDGRRIDGHRIVTATLPVAFAPALGELARLVERERPVLALALGLAAGRARISLERVALNLIDARIPDNAGAQPVDVAVIADAPAAYFTTLPVKAMLRALHEHGVPAELSLSAGTYVCNAACFALLHLAATQARGMRAGFIHLPLLPAQAARHPGTPSLDLATQSRGIGIALCAALSTATDRRDPGGALC
jgi:pyroglutamyl-peptidase